MLLQVWYPPQRQSFLMSLSDTNCNKVCSPKALCCDSSNKLGEPSNHLRMLGMQILCLVTSSVLIVLDVIRMMLNYSSNIDQMSLF